MAVKWARIAVAAAVAVLLAKPALDQKMRYGVYVEPGPMDGVLLKDYKPESSLVVPETRIDKARFPVIDAHTHSFMNGATEKEVDDWVRSMDESGIQLSIVFTDAIGAEFDRQAELFLKRHPGRFQVYCSLDLNGYDQPGFSERSVRELERCYRHGARGVGEMSDKGWGLMPSVLAAKAFQGQPVSRDRRLHADDPRLEAVWEKCAELKMPVNLHIADHPSCWRPLGPTQERTPDFQHFNLYGKDVPSWEDLIASRDRLLARHPRTLFVAAHLGNQGHNLAALAAALDRYPNLVVDLSARDYELGREPRTAPRFLTKYQDRVLFGTDMGRDVAMYRGWWRLLESADEYLPGRIWWRLYGLELAPEVLEKLYRENARRILPGVAALTPTSGQ
jgi:hypothetical protein